MRILSVVGARPQFIKLAAMTEALSDAGHEHVIVHTGQHYDDAMSAAFFADLKIPDPDVNLGVGSASHGVQTGRMLAGLDPVLDHYRPDWVLVYGDTNATVAGALAAVKLHLPVAHVEAGLRSRNRGMPEEHNRVATDHLADLLLAPTKTARLNLDAEGLRRHTYLVGDVAADVLWRVHDSVCDGPRPPAAPAGEYLLATVHRAENTDDPERLAAIVGMLAQLPLPVVLPVHPRLAARAAAAGVDLAAGALRPVDAQPYPAMVQLLADAAAVVTDSGGLIREAYLLRVPCTTLRAETEWAETLVCDWNVCCADLADLPDLAVRGAPYIAAYRRDVPAAPRVVEVLAR
jgi:UDP-N-acetylglucosamine 2-epimerase (non-hydrolysing)